MISEKLKRADRLRGKSRYREALSLLRQIMRSSCEGPDEMFQCNLLAGHTYRMLGNFSSSAEHYEKAVALADGMKDRTRAADARISLALSLRGMGRWADALRLLNSAEKFYTKGEDAEALAFLEWARAGTLRIKGDIDGAIGGFRTAYGMFTKLGDGHAAGFCLNGLGGATRIKGFYGKSLAHYTSANGLFGKLREPFGLAYSFCGVGNALRMQGDWKGALSNFGKALRIYERIGDIVSSSYTLWSMSKTFSMLGKNDEARQSLRQAERLFRKTKDPKGLIYCLLNEAELAAMAGKRKKALEMLENALMSAKHHAFGVEACHAKALLSIVRDGRADNGCYRKLGLRMRPGSLPVNIP